MQDLFTRYRGVIIFLFVLPTSFVVQQIQNLQNWLFRKFRSSSKNHDAAVKHIQEEVKAAAANNEKMCTARAPWKTMSIRLATYKKGYRQIPVNLRSILSLDTSTRILRVEPMVTMGELTRYLVPRKHALAVQVEMDDLTVGGLCMGIGIETTSHARGFLFETVVAYEIVTAEGALVRATREEHTDLFHALPMSHGTLGFLVAVELEVVPVKEYMKVRYLLQRDMETFQEQLTHWTDQVDAPEYIEALVFSEQKGVIMLGEMVDKVPNDQKINAINRWYKPLYHKHIEASINRGDFEEYIPIRHYFHRHTPSMFFQIKDLIPFANAPWYRWIFAWMGAPKISIMKFSMTQKLRKRAFENRVAQDIVIPIDSLADAIHLAAKKYTIYPLWVCPVKIKQKGEHEGLIRASGTGKEMFVDLGIYGIPSSVKEGTWNALETSRMLEHYTRERGGFHMLYADIFMNQREFEQMFNHDLYRSVRSKYKATEAFPEVYDKVIPESWLMDVRQLGNQDEVQDSNQDAEQVEEALINQ